MNGELGGSKNGANSFHGSGDSSSHRRVRKATGKRNPREHSAGLLPHPHGLPGRIPLVVGSAGYSGVPGLVEVVSGLSPVLSIAEVCQVLTLLPEAVLRAFPVFGPEDDRSVLRDDVLEFLARSVL